MTTYPSHVRIRENELKQEQKNLKDYHIFYPSETKLSMLQKRFFGGEGGHHSNAIFRVLDNFKP